MKAVPVVVVAVVLAAGVAHAQSPHQAVQKPLPELRSPMPSLPPPTGQAAPEPRSGLLPNGDGTYRWEGLTFVAHVDADGSIHFSDRGPFAWDPQQFGMTFDLTDLVMRRRGEDPYRYEKHKVMAATYDDRVNMREESDRQTMRAALDDLPLYLYMVWTQPTWSFETKRRVLFELWDECAEEGNALVAAGGGEAREIIVEFVRRNLPPGSRFAFTPGELAALNARRESRSTFTPYGLSVTDFTARAAR